MLNDDDELPTLILLVAAKTTDGTIKTMFYDTFRTHFFKQPKLVFGQFTHTALALNLLHLQFMPCNLYLFFAFSTQKPSRS